MLKLLRSEQELNIIVDYIQWFIGGLRLADMTTRLWDISILP